MFSSKLSRAEALAQFRKRFQVPLEWEDLVTASDEAAGRLMTRSALHHLIWVVRVSMCPWKVTAMVFICTVVLTDVRYWWKR
jgi:hypothetical protein